MLHRSLINRLRHQRRLSQALVARNLLIARTELGAYLLRAMRAADHRPPTTDRRLLAVGERHETGDTRRETRDGRHETGDTRRETRDRRPETGDYELPARDQRHKTGDSKPETGDIRPQTTEQAGDPLVELVRRMMADSPAVAEPLASMLEQPPQLAPQAELPAQPAPQTRQPRARRIVEIDTPRPVGQTAEQPAAPETNVPDQRTVSPPEQPAAPAETPGSSPSVDDDGSPQAWAKRLFQPVDDRRPTTDDRRPTTDDRPLRIEDRPPTSDYQSARFVAARMPTADHRPAIAEDRGSRIEDRKPGSAFQHNEHMYGGPSVAARMPATDHRPPTTELPATELSSTELLATDHRTAESPITADSDRSPASEQGDVEVTTAEAAEPTTTTPTTLPLDRDVINTELLTPLSQPPNSQQDSAIPALPAVGHAAPAPAPNPPADDSPQAWAARLFPSQQPSQPTAAPAAEPRAARLRPATAAMRPDPHSLPETTRRFLRPLVGIDPAQTRIYQGPQAEQLASAYGADALTAGSDIFIGAGHADSSPATLGLLAHELTHVARQIEPRFVPPIARRAQPDAANEEGVARTVEAQVLRAAWLHEQQAGPAPLPADAAADDAMPMAPAPTGDYAQPGPVAGDQVDAAGTAWAGLPAPWEPLPAWLTPAQEGASPQQGPSPVAATPSQNGTPSAAAVQLAEIDRDVESLPAAVARLSPAIDGHEQPQPPDPDLDVLARQVYAILKNRLAVERRRG